MNYEIVKVNEIEYKLCLPMRQIVEMEKKIGNPLNTLIAMGENGNQIPSFEFLGNVLMYSLKKHQPKMGINETYDLIDDYLAEDHDLTDLITLILKVFEVSGYFRAGQQQSKK